MSLPKDFWEQLPLKTDGELYDMLGHQDDYVPEALAAAKEELRKRNLAPEQVAQLEALAHSQKVAEESKADERLSWPMRILVFFACSGMLGAVLAVYYDSKGYKKKSRECWITMVISIAVSLLMGCLLYLTR